MASLTITAQWTKKIFRGSSLFVVAIILLIVVFMFGKNITTMMFPPKADPALVAFGQLPPVALDEGSKPSKNVTYKVETVSGDLKELKTMIKVFAIDTNAPKFGDLSRANDLAQRAQYTVPAYATTNDTASYLNNTNKNETLTINITSGDIAVKSDYLNNPSLINSQVKDEASAKKTAQTFLSPFGLTSVEYPEDKAQTIKYKIDGNKLAESLSIAGTNLVQVNFTRGDIDEIPVVYTTYNNTKVTVLVSNNDVVSAKSVLTKIQEYRFSTYPLKGINKAFSDLQAGKAIFNKDLQGNEFVIRDTRLAYLDTNQPQKFLQPVYVFESDDGLEAYVPAVNDAWVAKAKTN